MAYIPRSSLTNTPVIVPSQIQKKHTFQVFNFIAIFVTVGTLLATVGVFFYFGYANGQLNIVKNSLSQKSAVGNEKNIEEIYTYQKKLQIAQHLLDAHIAPSRLFAALENSVNSTVQFQSLEFSYDPGFTANLSILGVTSEFDYLALQKIKLTEGSIFSNFVLSKIGLVDSKSGETSVKNVGFSISGVVQNDQFSYTGKVPEEVSFVPQPDPVQTAVVKDSASTTSAKAPTP